MKKRNVDKPYKNSHLKMSFEFSGYLKFFVLNEKVSNKGLIGPDVVKFQKFRENEFWLLTTTFILSHLHWI